MRAAAACLMAIAAIAQSVRVQAEDRPPAGSAPAVRCESVQAEIVSLPAKDAATDPVLLPGIDLNCEFPVISSRLMEEGTVTLNVQVLADGKVGSAALAIPDRHARLNDAALRIAQTKLKFDPATQKGRAVDAERQISLTFKIAPPDPYWFINASFQNPPPAEQLAFGLDGLRWGMTPDDVRRFLPTLGPTDKLRGQPWTNQGALYVDEYRYGGCAFWLSLYFAGGHLSWLTFTSSDSCGSTMQTRARVESELKARYGDASFTPMRAPDWTQARWNGAVTAIIYNYVGSVEVSFPAVAAPPLIIFN
jgi:TonB family protein